MGLTANVLGIHTFLCTLSFESWKRWGRDEQFVMLNVVCSKHNIEHHNFLSFVGLEIKAFDWWCCMGRVSLALTPPVKSFHWSSQVKASSLFLTSPDDTLPMQHCLHWSLRICSLMKHAHCRCQEAKARDHTYYDGLVWKNKLDMNQNETKCSFIHALNILKYLTIRGLFLAFKLISLARKYQTMSTKWSDKTSFFLFFAKVLILGWGWLHESYHTIYTMAGNIRYWIKNVSWNLSA